MKTCVFQPSSATKTIAASTTTASASVSTMDNGKVFRIFNSTAAIAFIRIGRSGRIGNAVNTDMPIAAGQIEFIACTEKDDTVAVLLASGTGSVYITKGDCV